MKEEKKISFQSQLRNVTKALNHVDDDIYLSPPQDGASRF